MSRALDLFFGISSFASRALRRAEACDFWMTYLGLSDVRSCAYLAGFLRDRLPPRDGGWIAPFRKTAAVITWGRPS